MDDNQAVHVEVHKVVVRIYSCLNQLEVRGALFLSSF